MRGGMGEVGRKEKGRERNWSWDVKIIIIKNKGKHFIEKLDYYMTQQF